MSLRHDHLTRRSVVLGAAAVGLAGLQRPARAAFPDRLVTVVVPFPPGGPNDIIGRLVGRTLDEAKMQNIVENRPGAGGSLGLGTVARAAADGYTVILPSGVSYVTQPVLTQAAPYEVEALRPITIVTNGPSVLAVRKDLEAKTVKDLVALAKEKPGRLTYGSSGVGTTLHLGGELFKSMAGVDIVHIPYKGTSEVVVDLIAGRIDMSFISPFNARKLVDEERVRALATTGKARQKGWEDTPTVMEDGVSGYELDGWYPLLAPAGTPDEAVKALNEAVAKGIRAKEAADRLTGLGFTALGTSVEDAEKLIAAETAKWTKLIREAKLSAG